jgi:hypothetical protein
MEPFFIYPQNPIPVRCSRVSANLFASEKKGMPFKLLGKIIAALFKRSGRYHVIPQESFLS